ncbi:MAG: hypothetical protein ACRDNF_16135 [Streptosporangiaceae bacterium]
MPPETALTPDHAGSILCRLLTFHPEVVGIRILGQTDMPDGIVSYSLGVILPGGRELYIDVEDAPRVTGAPSASRADTPL